jgi:Cu(I)/Ag(I) efflux system protein CusF
MRNMLLTVAGALALTIAAPAPIVIAQSVTTDTYEGVVTRVDESAGKITIRHGPMPKFDLHSTHNMVFRANDPAMLKQIKAGDKVRFEADRIKGQFTVIKIEKIK